MSNKNDTSNSNIGTQPIKLSKSTKFNWYQLDRLRDDSCYLNKRNEESVYPGIYQTTGYDPTRQDSAIYGKLMSSTFNNQKQYYNTTNYVDDDTKLIQSNLTNLRTINQLSTRPYLGNYMGPGRHSLNPESMDAESFLWQGYATSQQQPCEVTSGKDITSYALNYLPCFGNPQRVEHIIPPPVAIGGWVRGGAATRDIVRQVDAQRQHQNKQNSQMLRNMNFNTNKK